MSTYIKLQGGLGNQMFQYAFYLVMKNSKKDFLIDVSFYKKQSLRKQELTAIFNIDQSIFKDLSYVKRIILFFTQYNEYYIFYNKRLLQSDYSLYSGYFQSYKYFDNKNFQNQVRKSFVFPGLKDKKNIEIQKKIFSSESVSIHVRRGDFVLNKIHGDICNLKYYNNAINKIIKMKPGAHFFVFSDDPDWVSRNLRLDNHKVSNINWNRGENSFRDMQLMSMCKYNIIANSSFSWWAAWLNNYKFKIVLCPKKWTQDNIVDMSDLIPKNWIIMNE